MTKPSLWTWRHIRSIIAPLVVAALTATVSPVSAAEPTTDRTNLSFTGSKYTSKYHLYAGGLDWSKPVGLLIYGDGTGEYGIENPGGRYLIGGTNGLHAVAKRHNMVLLTPFSPNRSCECWYKGDPMGYSQWLEQLVKKLEADYPIDLRRVAMGGYSSGAQLATRWWVPSGAAQRTMTDGVVVAISYGGPPAVASQVSEHMKSNVPIHWDSGSEDPATTNAYGVAGGYKWYTDRGFITSLTIASGVGHGRSGQFGVIMDEQITKHIAVGNSTPT